MPNVLNFLPNATSQPEAQIFLTTVAAPAPKTPSAPLVVDVDWNDTIQLRVDSWAPIWGPVMPQVGDAAVVVSDDQRYFRCVWWGASATASPPRETAARTYVSTAAHVGPGLAQLPFDSITFDAGENLNLGLGVYVVPYTGVYAVSGQATVVPASSASTMQTWISVCVNGVEQSRGTIRPDVTTTTGNQVGSVVHDLVTCNAGDQISLWVYVSSATTLSGVGGSGTGLAGDGATSLTNYMSVTHASYW